MHVRDRDIRQAHITRIGHNIGIGNHITHSRINRARRRLDHIRRRHRRLRDHALRGRNRRKPARRRGVRRRRIRNRDFPIYIRLRHRIIRREGRCFARGNCRNSRRRNRAQCACAAMGVRDRHIAHRRITRIRKHIGISDHITHSHIRIIGRRLAQRTRRRKDFRTNALIRRGRHICPARRRGRRRRCIRNRRPRINVSLRHRVICREAGAIANRHNAHKTRTHSAQCPCAAMNIRNRDVRQAHITRIRKHVSISNHIPNSHIRIIGRRLGQRAIRRRR